MIFNVKRIGALALRLSVGLALLGWPGVGSAQGTWSVVSLPPKSGPPQTGQVVHPTALALDAAGNLYVADGYYDTSDVWHSRIQKRDAQGNWSVIATTGTALGQVRLVNGLAVDTAGNLYVADPWVGGRIQKRDAQGNWSVIPTWDWGLGPVWILMALAVDRAGNLYVADVFLDGLLGVSRIQKRDARGNWFVIAANGSALGQVHYPNALAVDAAGNLYVADGLRISRIQKRDAQGNWSEIFQYGASDLAVDSKGNLYAASGGIEKRDAQGQGNWSVVAHYGAELGQVKNPAAVAVDAGGNLYVADDGMNAGRIQKRDAQGQWSVIATDGWEPGQIAHPSALAVDAAGNLYVEDDVHGIQKRDAQGNWSVIGGPYHDPRALAVDAAGNLYVADGASIHERDAQGNWSLITTFGHDLSYPDYPTALAVGTTGELYAVKVDGFRGQQGSRIQYRDVQGRWSVIEAQVGSAFSALAADAAGNLYVAWINSDGDVYEGGIEKRDAQGNWSVIATEGSPSLAADGAGNLYVADWGNSRVLKYTPAP